MNYVKFDSLSEGSKPHGKTVQLLANTLISLGIYCRKSEEQKWMGGDKISAMQSTALIFDAVRLYLVSFQGSEYLFHQQRSFRQP